MHQIIVFNIYTDFSKQNTPSFSKGQYMMLRSSEHVYFDAKLFRVFQAPSSHHDLIFPNSNGELLSKKHNTRPITS